MGKARKFNFTQRAVESLAAPTKGRVAYGDAAEQGLTLTVTAAGAKYFSWYKKVQGWPTWRAIGPYPQLSVEDARLRAKELSSAVARWKSDGYPPDKNPLERREEVTLDKLVDAYVKQHLEHEAKNPAKAAKDVRWIIAKYAPAFRQRKLDTIRHEDIRALFRKIGATRERTANSVKELFVRLFNFAIREKLFTGENPALGIKGFHNVKRDRFFQPSELPLLWTALRRSGNLDLQHFVNLALFTAVRKADILSAKWSDVSLADNSWKIPNPKSRTPYVVPLSPEAVEIFRERGEWRTSTEWVFPSRAKTKTGHVTDLKRAWRKLLADAGLDYKDNPEKRPTQHDLRRTNASVMAAQGTSLIVIGKGLGHAPGSNATAIYARTDLSPVREAMSNANAALAAMMKKKPPKLLKAASFRLSS